MLIAIKGKIFDIIMINCYASTEITDSDQKDTFYETLERNLNTILKTLCKYILRH